MSIVDLRKITVTGRLADKQAVIAGLQDLGCLEIISLRDDGHHLSDAVPTHSREAFTFLATCPEQRPQLRRGGGFDAVAVEAEALDLKHRLERLDDERNRLIDRIDQLAVWGDFTPPSPAELGGYRLWFYVVGRNELAAVQASGLTFQVVRRRGRELMLVVIARDEPAGMPTAPIYLGDASRSALLDRLEEVQQALADAQAARAALTRWLEAFAAQLASLEDQEERQRVGLRTEDNDTLFVLQAWAPVPERAALADFCRDHTLALCDEEPDEAEEAPTLLTNSRLGGSGEDLVNFYMTPGFRAWDPSLSVLLSFGVFFAMILADAGYALLLGVVTWLCAGLLKSSPAGRRFHRTLVLLTWCALIYGVLIGSYFGVAASEGSVLHAMAIIPFTDDSWMMALTVLIGAAHLCYANLRRALRFGAHRRAVPPLGWALAVLGGCLLGFSGQFGDSSEIAGHTGIALMVLGGVCVLGFASGRGLQRVVNGLLSLTKVTSMFGDVLSYLRLFALGLAAAKLAEAFNAMAADVESSMPGIGFLLAILILVAGHGLNFVLSLAGGFIHGLRLNLIEFFNWAIEGEGRLFRPFRHKEATTWTR